MKIAIIGAGFAGLSMAFHLLQNKAEVTIFDELGIGGKASGIAAGLLHPYSGLHAKLNRFGQESMADACDLLEASQNALSSQVYASSGMLRLALDESQELDYLNCAKMNSNVHFLDAEGCQKLEPLLPPLPGILVEEAKTVYTKPYLKGLFLACENLGAKLVTTKIDHLDDLQEFDHVVVTAGADTHLFPELQSLSLYLVKGQILEIEWPESLKPLKRPLNSQGYILMSEDNKSCIAGATFERNFSSKLKDQPFAESEILPKIFKLLPALKGAKILECKSAVRVSTKDHLPIVQKLNPRLSVFVGLGSKGLLYHGFYAKKLTQIIMNERGL